MSAGLYVMKDVVSHGLVRVTTTLTVTELTSGRFVRLTVTS